MNGWKDDEEVDAWIQVSIREGNIQQRGNPLLLEKKLYHLL